MQKRLAVISAIVLVGCCASVRAEPERHPIKLTRAMMVGDQLEVRANASIESETFVVDGKQKKRIASSQVIVALDSVAQVIKVDGYGRPIALAHVINELTMMENGRRSELLPRGTAMIARKRGSEMSYFVKKRKFTDMELRALEAVAPLETYRSTDDELFGTKVARRVGEHWPVNAEEVAQEFRKMTGSVVPASGIRGAVSFEEIREHQGLDCQLIRTELLVFNALPGLGKLPAGTRLKSASLKVQSYELLPLELDLPPVADWLSLDMAAVLTDDSQQKPIDIEITGLIKAQHEYVLLDQAAGAEP